MLIIKTYKKTLHIYISVCHNSLDLESLSSYTHFTLEIVRLDFLLFIVMMSATGAGAMPSKIEIGSQPGNLYETING